MRKIRPDYTYLREDDIMFAYRKYHPKDVFPVYYQGYDLNWDEHQWSDGEGTIYGDQELVFVEKKDWDKQRQLKTPTTFSVKQAKKVTEVGREALKQMHTEMAKKEPEEPKKEMTDLWLSPYGEVIKCEPGSWKHATTAGKILNERYGYKYDTDYPELGWDDELERKGWVRWTSCTGCGWILRPEVKPTASQLDKIFELTGYIPDDIW